MNVEETLEQIASDIKNCQKCMLHQFRKNAVPGEGPGNSEIMFIGEGPGFNENEQGRPFVGAAGNFLNELLHSAGMKRSDVWIGNVIKCRPPGNRDPLPDELAACNVYLEGQIAAINPKIIITLGRFSMNKFLPGTKISSIHGQMRRVGNHCVIAMFHPAAALHQPTLKPAIIKDFTELPTMLLQARSLLKRSPLSQADDPVEEPKQLRLF